MRAMRSLICLALMGVLTTATCDDDDNPGSNPNPVPNPDQDLPQAGGGAGIGLDVVAEGLTSPVALVAAPDSSGRLFIVDQIGTIRVVARTARCRTSRFSTCAI